MKMNENQQSCMEHIKLIAKLIPFHIMYWVNNFYLHNKLFKCCLLCMNCALVMIAVIGQSSFTKRTL